MHPAIRFDREVERSSSSYLSYRENQLVDAVDGTAAPVAATVAHDLLRSAILDSNFPCVGAQGVMNTGGYRLGWFGRMGTVEAAASLFHGLCSFVQEQPTMSTRFTSYFAIFESPQSIDEEEFEQLLWLQLQAVHDLDSRYYDWDPSVSSDPTNTRFAFSVAGRGFYIVGMHGSSSRADRRFAYPTLIFNAQFMFDQLRAENKYLPMQRTIRDRSQKMGLDVNPLLANFGEGAAAPQYSGRHVGPEWICPLRVNTR